MSNPFDRFDEVIHGYKGENPFDEFERQQEKSLPDGSALEAVGEPIAAVVTGLGNTISGGFEGAFAAATGGVEAGAQAVEDAQSRTYRPGTRRGQENLQVISEGVQSAVDAINYPLSGLTGLTELLAGQDVEQAIETIKSVQEVGVGETLGRRVLEETGSPELATLARVTPEAAVELLALKGAGVVKKGAAKPKLFQYESSFKKELTRVLDSATVNGAAPKLSLDNPKIKGDPKAVAAVKQGFDEGVVAVIKQQSLDTRARMLKMVNISERGMKNKRFAMRNRPSDVAGDALMEKVRVVQQRKKKAGAALDTEASKLKNKQVDFEPVVETFTKNLGSMGISLEVKGGKIVPNFYGSDVEKVVGAEKVIKNIVSRISNTKVPDAYDLHRLKRYIDENASYGVSGEGLKGRAESVVKALRHDVDALLDKNFAGYDSANQTYAESVGALNAIQDVAGRKIDLNGPNSDKAIGTLLRRVMSNAQSRVQLIDAIDQIEKIPQRKVGADVDLMSLVLFADEIDAVFTPVARTSLQGEVGKSVRTAADIAIDPNAGITGMVVNAASSAADRIRGINQEGAYKAIRELLDGAPSGK